jgi:hypothetical protein
MDLDPFVRGMDPRIRIQIRIKISWLRSTGTYMLSSFAPSFLSSCHAVSIDFFCRCGEQPYYQRSHPGCGGLSQQVHSLAQGDQQTQVQAVVDTGTGPGWKKGPQEYRQWWTQVQPVMDTCVPLVDACTANGGHRYRQWWT